ncbi:MAG: DUF4349 domain-containing protein, partial [Eubacteriales bacterium]|nr:DUF4349 domain-containing protein [Eubacteriales bacterium]
KDSLLALLAKAEKVSDIIAIQSQLTSVRYELDNYNSRLRKYDDLISYSTVTMNISEVERLTEVEQKTVWEQISSRLSDSLYAVGRGFRNFFIWFVGSLPYIVVIAVLAVIALFIIKASVKCRRKRKAAKTKE